MAATTTTTGTIGAGVAVTAAVLNAATSVTFDCVNNLLTVQLSTGPVIYSIAAATTITATKSGSAYTFTVS